MPKQSLAACQGVLFTPWGSILHRRIDQLCKYGTIWPGSLPSEVLRIHQSGVSRSRPRALGFGSIYLRNYSDVYFLGPEEFGSFLKRTRTTERGGKKARSTARSNTAWRRTRVFYECNGPILVRDVGPNCVDACHTWGSGIAGMNAFQLLSVLGVRMSADMGRARHVIGLWASSFQPTTCLVLRRDMALCTDSYPKHGAISALIDSI